MPLLFSYHHGPLPRWKPRCFGRRGRLGQLVHFVLVSLDQHLELCSSKKG
jgi:hypothetical protein